ncbi:hypothetical protein GF385_04260 [Candidatus Dependentiae bacterium]|nr:hypothetical protein [Candidatus Dependentiae bacterium]
MLKNTLFLSLILVGNLFSISMKSKIQKQERIPMQGLRNGSGQRKMDGTGPRAQAGKCLK